MSTVRVALLGCGTVGLGVVNLLRANASALARRVGAELELAWVLERETKRALGAGVDKSRITANPDVVFNDASVQVVIEVLGGLDPALQFVERAITTGRSVVTANKMLLAKHGSRLFALAEKNRVDLAFEASVGGGIPIIRVFRDALPGDKVESFHGIVNGTCNYMLTRMRSEGLTFDDALSEAQLLGYAEAEPSLDVDGHDAAHKLVVLATLAFGADLDGDHPHTEGIRAIEPIDHRFADRFGFIIKHLAIGRDRGEDGIELRVHPALIRRDSALANVGGVFNAIALEGRALGPALLSGRGAGQLPTAVSVVGDVADVARARMSGAAGLSLRGLEVRRRLPVPMEEVEGRYYLRFPVFDRSGVLAKIAGALGDARVSIEQMVQEGRGDANGEPVQVVMLTHTALEKDVRAALQFLNVLDFVVGPICVIRVHEAAV